ncbi:MAG: acyl-CoA dehydrogenase family protein [Thermodesulfobacteriota bacterium]
MALQLTNEQHMIQLMVRDFARKEIEPVAGRLDREGTFPWEILHKMAHLGLMGMMVPERYGGSNVGAVSYCLAMQEIAYSCPSTAVTMAVCNLACEPLVAFGTEEQKQRYLVPLARGEKLGAFAVTEPQAGSDAAGIRMRAERVGGHYELTGTKMFITNGSYAGVLVVLARTSEEAHRGISGFLVEPGFRGFSVGTVEDKMGLRASNTAELVLEQCEVPAENLLGQEGDGFRMAMAALDTGRIGIASQSVGMARACFDEAVRYSKERKQFGKYICTYQAIQWMLADMATEIEAAKLLSLQAAFQRDRGEAITMMASMAKLYASEMVNRVAFRATQIFGGYGFIKENKVERIYRDARVTTVYEGTSEVQRMVIARQVLKGS